MHPQWLSNAYLVADSAGGTAVFIDSGAPIEPLLSAVDRLEVHPTHLLTTHAHADHVAHHESSRTVTACDPGGAVRRIVGRSPLRTET